jgi:hypothetical protein
MSERDGKEDDVKALARAPGRWQGEEHAAPYPLSRMAPAFDLVDMAAEIQKADAMLATVAEGKLVLIAEQIRALQQQAHALLEKARRDAELHRVPCRFEKRPGGVYHLYRRHATGERYFSLLGPDEWITKPAQDYEGSFRLEADQSFTPLDQAESKDAERRAVAALLR